MAAPLSAGLAGWFALQLSFAETMTERSGRPLSETIEAMTTLRRRLGWGEPGDPPLEEWRAFLDALLAAPDADSRVRVVMAASQTRFIPFGRSRKGDLFGCFSVEPPPAPSEPARLHFAPADVSNDEGPLAPAKRPQRRAELAALARHVAERHGPETTLEGGSWLYNLAAYRALFPPAYLEPLRPIVRRAFPGLTFWGQFLDHRQALRETAAAQFRANLRRLDPERPWTVFPLQALQARAPVAAFLAHFAAD